MQLMKQEIKKSRGEINLVVYVTPQTMEVRAGVGGSHSQCYCHRESTRQWPSRPPLYRVEMAD
jgi:hypothetical protein